ncbi:cobalt ECF transporter T component CbiQ [Pseudodesulfovibrio pelocollis]|uniref:cobalt ECF transporter T component CbiQ n=1 Tax=Pseudodesulfovibrio pelocollis TaxID=3051432 RepID=UPI00255AA3DB|nr:cobalt ECF transporter T component CbiQ [Pseudodesulfovibrio sp. SB368]
MATIDQSLAHGDSIIHTMDPRVRLGCAVLLTVTTALLHWLPPALLALATGAGLTLLAGLRPQTVIRRLAVVNVFIVFLWIFLPFSVPLAAQGEPVLRLGPLAASRAGVDLALLITVKSNAIVLTLLALMATIPMQDLGPAMQRLKVPEKLCHILLFTYRYLFVIHQEYRTMRRAMAARGFTPGTNRHTYRAVAWLMGMLLVRSWDRAERVHSAMRCRGFRGRFHSMARFTVSARDVMLLAGCTAMAAAFIWLETTRRGLA